MFNMLHVSQQLMLTFCDHGKGFSVLTVNSLLYLKSSLVHKSGMHQVVCVPKTVSPAHICQDNKYVCFVCFFGSTQVTVMILELLH